nr:hypothetical protein [uncultured Anaeromusa sp.]
MSRKYTKVETIAAEVFRRRSAGETYRQISETYPLTFTQIKNLLYRHKRKRNLIAKGYVVRKKGRPVKDSQDAEVFRNNELIELRMQIEVLRNFLLEVGRM